MSLPAPQLRAPLLWLLLPLMAGISAGRIWPAPAAGPWLLLLGATVSGGLGLWAAFTQRPALWMPALLLSVAFSGCAYLHVRYPHLHDASERPPREVTVTLKVLRLFPAVAPAKSYTGVGLITTAPASERSLLGQRVYFSAIRRISVVPRPSGAYTIRGVVQALGQPATDAGFSDFLASLGIGQQILRAQLRQETSPPGFFSRLCARMEAGLASILGLGLEQQPEVRSIYLAMLIGAKAELNPEQKNAFIRSGTYHVFSISGLHVGVIASALLLLGRLVRAPHQPAMLASLTALWLYVQVTGASTPALRSWLMIAFVMSAKTFRVPGNYFAALTASALATLLLDPVDLFSTGFQMSYAVMSALILLGGPLGAHWQSFWHPFVLRPRPEWRWRHRFINWAGRWMLGTVAGCWAAFLASMPAGIGFFGLLAPGSLPANLIIIPLATATIVAGFVSLLLGVVGLTILSAGCNTLAALLITGSDWLLRQGADVPGMAFQAQFRAPWLAPAALALVTAVMLAGASTRWSRRYGGFWSPLVVLIALLVFGVKFGD